VAADPLPTFAFRLVIGILVGLLLHRFASSKSELSLDILLGAAGGLVGGTIASFLELAAFDPYRNPAGAVLGAVFFVLGWDQMLRQR
jgi:uncharacterized membrane protein YeaQ/YmgE (transglycosylase-associated protein family)